MATGEAETEVASVWPDEAHTAESVAYLQAHGVRPATRSLNRPRVIGKQRPRWLALLFRTLERLHPHHG